MYVFMYVLNVCNPQKIKTTYLLTHLKKSEDNKKVCKITQ